MGTVAACKKSDVIQIKNEWCKGCGLCVDFCAKKVLSLSYGKAVIEHPENCVGCGMCELYCPDFAISMNRPEEQDATTKTTAR